MDTTLVEKLGLTDGRTPAVCDENQLDGLFDDIDGYRAFIATRQAGHQASMLGLALKSGEYHSLAYSHLYRLHFHSNQLVLYFTEHEVVLTGRCMKELYRRLQLQAVLEVVEADSPAIELAGTNDCVVTGIVIEQPGA